MKKYALLLTLTVIMLFALTACRENEGSVVGSITVTERNAGANAVSHFDVRIISETVIDTGFGLHGDYGGYSLVFELENTSGRAVTVDITAVFPGEHGGYSGWLIDQNIHFEPGQTKQFTHIFGEYNYTANLIIEYWISQETSTAYPDIYLFHESVNRDLFFDTSGMAHAIWHRRN